MAAFVILDVISIKASAKNSQLRTDEGARSNFAPKSARTSSARTRRVRRLRHSVVCVSVAFTGL